MGENEIHAWNSVYCSP